MDTESNSINGMKIEVRNLRTGQVASSITGEVYGSGEYFVTLIGLYSESLIRAGDALEVFASAQSKAFRVSSTRVFVTPIDLERGWMVLPTIEAETIPTETRLLPNFPNPFNPETWIPFDLAQSANVRITIYSMSGEIVRVIVLRNLPAGSYTNRSKAVHWDGTNSMGECVASGLYFYRLEAGSFHATRRMVILK